MKLKNIALSLMAVGFTATSSQAALITLINGAAATASGIQTVAGLTFRSGTSVGDALGGSRGGTSAGAGTVAFGFFTTVINSETTDFSNFVAFGNVGTFAAGGPSGNRSIFQSAQNVTVTGSQFDGKNIVLFAGNGTTFGTSSEFLVVDTGIAFNSVSDGTPTPTTLTVRPDSSTLLFGSTVLDVYTTNIDTSVTPGWSMATPVPEPSAALLGALGVLGLLRRRRN